MRVIIPPERIFAVVANLLDRFHLKPCDIGKLTDRQVYQLYFHRRNSDGGIDIPGGGFGLEAPDRPMSLSEELSMLDSLAVIGRWKPEYVEQLKVELREKFTARAKANPEAPREEE